MEADTFVKIANDLGIRWFCLTDGDATGAKTRTSRLPHFGGQPEAECLAVLSQPTIEHLLCEGGLGAVYEKRISSQKTTTGLTARKGDPDYWTQVLDCIPKEASKEDMAIEAMALMRRYGPSSIPADLKNVIDRTVAQAAT